MNTERMPRTILHCDCNNFYASVELLKFPELRDKPVAVAGDPEGRHGIILAKNMIAKRYGIQTAETVWQARKKCPDLILLPPHHDEYDAMSKRVNEIYCSVTDQVEPFSVDESWLDVTGSQRLFGDGKTIADELRRRVREELGITISVGVSDNKSWAKLGSDYKKPDATTVITRDNVAELLYPLPVQDMLFVGHAAAEVLRRHGVTTIGMLAAAPKDSLIKWLGKQGESLHAMANGLDDSPVRRWGEGEAVKSVGNGMTFPHDLVGEEAWKAGLIKWLGKQGESLHAMANGLDDSPVRRWGEGEAVKSVGNGMTFPHDLVGEEAWKAGLMPLCDSVGSRLRAHHLKCRTVTVQIKDPQLKVISRQRTLPMPTNLTKVIFREAFAILQQCWRKDAPIRLLTVTASTLCGENEEETAQLSFLSEVKPDDPRQLRIEQAVDGVRRRFGKSAIAPGTPKVE